MAKKHSTRRAKRKSGPTASETDAIVADYKTRPALMTKETVFELDAAIQADRQGVARRMGLVILSKPCQEFIESVQRDREFAVAIAQTSDAVAKYRENLANLVSWMEESERRMLVALAYREDLEAVLQEAKKSQQAEVSHHA